MIFFHYRKKLFLRMGRVGAHMKALVLGFQISYFKNVFVDHSADQWSKRSLLGDLCCPITSFIFIQLQ